jgi:hypothetical protein
MMSRLSNPLFDESGVIKTFSAFNIKKEEHVYVEPGIFSVRALRAFDAIIPAKYPMEALKLYEYKADYPTDVSDINFPFSQ